MRPGHALWTDAYLAAFAIAHGTKLATFDQGFKRFAGVDLLLIGSANQDSHRT
ncbi:MAG TPA: PIN domain-containing protein [Methylomirabilota bacterium]|nr:PIN domain-containing protein [Methylomirabilota bacterium]